MLFCCVCRLWSCFDFLYFFFCCAWLIDQAGLGLSYALMITRTLSFGVRSSTAMENQFNSVERVQQFIGLEQEVEEGEKREEVRRVAFCSGSEFFCCFFAVLVSPRLRLDSHCVIVIVICLLAREEGLSL